MRIATVVLPVAATAGAAALLALQLRPRAPAPPPRLAIVPVPVAVTAPAPLPPAPARYEHPVGGQFLETDLLVTGDHAPLLLERHDDEPDGFRYAWRYGALARAMASELAAVLDDACPTGCAHAAEARTALATWLDGDPAETHRLLRWTTDADGVPTYTRRLTVHAAAGAIAVDVTCTSESYTYGMHGWNDATSCEATLRDGRRVLASYRPRQLAVYEHDAVRVPIDSFEQRVTLADGSELVTETGWDYQGDPDRPDRVRTGVRPGPRWLR